MARDSLTRALRETLALFEKGGVPQTTTEVANRLDLGRRSTYERLARLVDEGRLNTKKVGGNGRVWWRPRKDRDRTSPDGEAAAETLTDDMSDQTWEKSTHQTDREQFKSLVDAVEEYAIFMLDPEGHVQTWNPGARQIKGYDGDEILGTHFSTFYTDEDQAVGIPAHNLATAAREGSVEDEGWRVRADGARFWANVTITAIRDDDGDLEGFAKVTRDMTDRREHEQELRYERDRLQEVLQTVPVGIGLFSTTGDIIQANERAIEILGIAEDEVDEYRAGERNIYDVDDNLVPPDERPYAQVLETGEPVFNWECQIEYPDGNRRWLSMNAVPLEGPEGEIDQIITTVKDITPLKEQAHRLERQRDDLESELENVFNRISDGFYGLDSDLRFSYLNDHAVELLDLSESDAIGSYVGDEIDLTDSFERSLVEAVEEGRSVVFEDYYEPFDAWFENAIYPSESGVSVYFRNVTERKQRERELRQYETIVETVNDGVYVLDAEAQFILVNDAFCELTGYDHKALLGSSAAMVVNEETQAAAGQLEAELMAGERERGSLEVDVQTADGETILAEATFAMLPGEDRRHVGVVRDISERKAHERELERQRKQLAALNNLNDVVRDINDMVIDQSIREEIEAVVCERLADVDSYEFAWFAEVDLHAQSIIPRVEAGVDGYLEEITLSMDADDPAGRGPVGRAIRTQEIQVVQDALTDSSFEIWRESAKTYGYRSSAAIPVVYDDTLYGVLGVYADRPKAFNGEERDVIAQLGEIVGHAIAAVDRKQALISDEVTALEFAAFDILDTIGLDSDVDGTITFDRTVPIGDGDFLEYGTVDEDAIDTLEALVDQLSHFEKMTIVDRGADTAQFELRLSEPPVVSAVAAHGGYLQQSRIEDGDLYIGIHLPPTVAARQVIDKVKDAYPTANLLKRRQITRSDDTLTQVQRAVTDDLTDRQRATLEVAVYSGFFEWPRKATGKELAELLGIAPPTFSQHLRKAEQKVFKSLLSSETPA
ncbi:PAS domain S-box protein [Halomicrococcus sp. NG-SE-24]|uniref:PAS domain S-box protein n=1 Tax=Halomicrococcus sp. NG-SE-24 TaxID=3436928 RepID=UPI003D96ED3C